MAPCASTEGFSRINQDPSKFQQLSKPLTTCCISSVIEYSTQNVISSTEPVVEKCGELSDTSYLVYLMEYAFITSVYFLESQGILMVRTHRMQKNR